MPATANHQGGLIEVPPILVQTFFRGDLDRTPRIGGLDLDLNPWFLLRVNGKPALCLQPIDSVPNHLFHKLKLGSPPKKKHPTSPCFSRMFCWGFSIDPSPKLVALGGVETVAFATGLPDLLAGRILEVARGVWCHEARSGRAAERAGAGRPGKGARPLEGVLGPQPGFKKGEAKSKTGWFWLAE